MKKISISKLRNIYQKLNKKDTDSDLKHSIFFYYLYLSIHKSREEREFDINNYRLLKYLIPLNLNPRFPNSKIKLKLNGFAKYLISQKEFQYLLSRKLPFIFFKDLLKYAKQLVDIFTLAIITLFFIIKNKLKKNTSKKLKFKSKKFYSIYYWMGKGKNSSAYYYPDINNQKNNLIFISSFADSKFLSSSLLHSINNTNFLNPTSILGLKGLFLSIFQFIHLFLYDLFLLFLSKQNSFLKFWIGWKKGSEIFYSLLIYNSIIEIAKNSYECEFVSWYENQFTNRAFSLGVAYSKKKLNMPCNLSTYYGSIFTEESLQQYIPNIYEKEIGLWGTKFYLQDYESLKEINTNLEKNRISMILEVVPESMIRSNYKKNEEIEIKNSKEITIFTHSTYWDLIACLLSIFNPLNRKNFIPIKESKQIRVIHIRLHPSLNKEIALKEIKNIIEIPKSVNYKFINNKDESIVYSMKSSKYCIFGLSAYVNLAININCRVFSVETNHINKAPIISALRNSPNLKVINPW